MSTGTDYPVSREDTLRHRGAWGLRLPLGFITMLCASVLLVAFLVLPLLALFLRVAQNASIASYLSRPVVVEALGLSAKTTTASLTIILLLGTPTAYLLARYSFPGRSIIDTIIDLPMVLPPAVAGVAMLMAFGRRGLLGGLLSQWGIELGFSTGAVIMAQVFVAAPFYIRSARAGFEKVPISLERVSATLGVSNWRAFWRITFRLAMPALLSGTVMAWARALGEFGATIMFAGNFLGHTQTMPLAIYSAMESDTNAALVIAALQVVISFGILLAFKLLSGSSRRPSFNA